MEVKCEWLSCKHNNEKVCKKDEIYLAHREDEYEVEYLDCQNYELGGDL